MRSLGCSIPGGEGWRGRELQDPCATVSIPVDTHPSRTTPTATLLLRYPSAHLNEIRKLSEYNGPQDTQGRPFAARIRRDLLLYLGSSTTLGNTTYLTYSITTWRGLPEIQVLPLGFSSAQARRRRAYSRGTSPQTIYIPGPDARFLSCRRP